MARTTTPQVVRSYLNQLKNALAGVPADVRDEIVAGVREELDGLDAAAAAARIEALGDPEFIAAEARAEAAVVVPTPVTSQADDPDREPRWLPVLAALLVAFGGIIVPVVGWIVGVALVWMSKSWRSRDKWIATLTPVIAICMFMLVFGLISAASGPSSTPGTPSTSDFAPNPLIPGFYSAVWSSMVLVVPVNALVGIWLLWRAKQAWSRREDTPQVQPAASASEHQPASPRSQPPANAPRRPQASWYAPLTILLIIGGGFLVPVVGWLAGVTMLWATDVWSTRDKWLGTLAGPVVALVPAALLIVARLWLPMSGGGFDPFLLIVFSGLVLPTVANVLVGIRLLRRSKGAAAGGAASGG